MSQRARILRRQSTAVEQQLWLRLRSRQFGGAKFRRQHPVGPYFADFCCVEARLIIEIDGGQHVICAEQDRHRTRWLEAQGYRVIRFWNNEVGRQMDAVLLQIWVALRGSS